MRQPPEKSRQGRACCLGIEAEAGEDGGGAGRGAMGLDIDQPGMDLADPVGIAARVSASASRLARSISAASTVSSRLSGPSGASWASMPRRWPAGMRDLAAIGLQRAGDELQQGRFAGAVAPDQPGMMAVGQGRG